MKKRISIILTILLLFPLITVYSSYLPQYEYEAQILYDMGLFKGNDTGFDLDKECDRVQGAVLFIRLMGKEQEALSNPKPHPFSDVSEWSNPYIGQMYYEEYTKGISSTEFGTGVMTANQFATFCLRALEYSETATDWKKFNYNNAMNKMLEENIITKSEYDIITSSDIFYRDFAVKLIYNTLFETGKNNQNKILTDRLKESGVNIDEYIKIPNVSSDEETISLSSAEDIYALSRILSSDWAKDKYYAWNSELRLENDFSRFQIPEEITTEKEKIEYLQTASYILTNDITVVLDTTASHHSEAWTKEKFIGIGSYYYPFKGTFNGNNKTITLSSKTYQETHSYSADNIGFFGETADASITNTNITVASDIIAKVSNTSDDQFAMGTLIGEAKTTILTNCTAKLSNVNFGIDNSDEIFEDYAYVGGLVGRSERSVFKNCKVILNDSSIYGKLITSNKKYAFGGVSVGGILGHSSSGSDNTNNIGRLGNQLYNCSLISSNTTQRDVLYTSIGGGTECTVGGIVGITYNNGVIKNCLVDIKNGNIISNQYGDTATSNLGSAVGGIIGRAEHTSQIVDCRVEGDCLNISSFGPDNIHLVGGIAGNAFGPRHRDVTPILNCHFNGYGTSTLSLKINTTNLKESSHQAGIGGIVGYLQYQMYDSSVKNVKIINYSEGMKKDSSAGKFVGIYEKACHSNGTWEPGPIEIDRCTDVGVTFDVSDNVIITKP